MTTLPNQGAHPDDLAVDRFAAAMKAKLAKGRNKGRGGWDDKTQCLDEFLAELLVDHLGKGNAGTFEDVANFAMMLHQRGANPEILSNASRASPHLRHLEHHVEQMNLLLLGVLAEHEVSGTVTETITDIRAYYANLEKT